jgi:hypothetical protein
VSIEDALATLQGRPEDDPPVLDRQALQKKLRSWTRDGQSSKARPLSTFSQILRNPTRVVVFLQKESLLTRSATLFDTACREFVDFKPRVRQMNTMSEAGVDFARLKREAEDRVRNQLSGRSLRPDGSIK